MAKGGAGWYRNCEAGMISGGRGVIVGVMVAAMFIKVIVVIRLRGVIRCRRDSISSWGGGVICWGDVVVCWGNGII